MKATDFFTEGDVFVDGSDGRTITLVLKLVPEAKGWDHPQLLAIAEGVIDLYSNAPLEHDVLIESTKE